MKLTEIWVSTYFFLGRFDEARTHLLAAKSLDDPNQHRSLALRYGQDPGITARIFLARTLWILGEVEQVETLALEAIGMARELEHPYTLVFTLVFLSWIYSTLRNAKRTLELTDEAIAVSTQYSFELGLAWATASQGWALAETWAGGRARQINQRAFRYSGHRCKYQQHVYLGVAGRNLFTRQPH